MSLFFALVMAIPNTAFKEKAKVLLVGEPVLFSLNLLRIYVTALCGYHYGMQTMILVHQVVWEALMPLLTVGAWLTWLYFTKLHGHKKRET